jgi:co-chaperonin GroES (HSP10)
MVSEGRKVSFIPRPKSGQVIITPEAPQEHQGLIQVDPLADKASISGIVMASAGTEHGLKRGDKVVHRHGSYHEFERGGMKLRIVPETEIEAIIQ